jgi:hypothetical protein
VAIGLVVGVIVISLLGMALCFVQKRKKRRTGRNYGYPVPSPFASSQNSGNTFTYLFTRYCIKQCSNFSNLCAS